jgi:hypothetical protein
MAKALKSHNKSLRLRLQSSNLVSAAFQFGKNTPTPPVFLAKSAQTHEKNKVAIFIGARKCKNLQKSAQEYENKGRKYIWRGARDWK